MTARGDAASAGAQPPSDTAGGGVQPPPDAAPDGAAALPDGFGVVLDHAVRRYRDGTVLVGGSPIRVMRLSPAGVRALESPRTRAARTLGARLVAAGVAHPVPGRDVRPPSVTVVVPTRDRPDALERCLAAAPEAVVVDDGSEDPAAIAAVCVRHGAQLLRRDTSGGPAAARNTALAHVTTDLVAFLDDDCVPPAGWLDLARHFADPAVAAVAPRVTDRALDMGLHPARVVPGTPVSYVPSAALLVRRAAVGRFDEDLRYGEDVDLVWRLHDAGWTVRYDPSVVVRHEPPAAATARLRREFAYGTSAGPLARRHGARLAPLRLAPLPALAATALLAGRPRTALALALTGPARNAKTLTAAGLPPTAIARLGLTVTGQTLVGMSRAARTVGAPLTLAALARNRTRRAATGLLLARTLERRISASTTQISTLNHPQGCQAPLRVVEGCGSQSARLIFCLCRRSAVSLGEDVAYGLGVWRGAFVARTAHPLIPRRATTRSEPDRSPQS